MANSWLEAAVLLDLDFSLAVPKGYEPRETLLAEARKSDRFLFTHDPAEAARGADVLYTDVWVSMGQEGEREERMMSFVPFRIDEKLLGHAKKDAIVMHCLPAHRNKEISDHVFEEHHEVIFGQAENRLHTQKALLEWLIAGNTQ